MAHAEGQERLRQVFRRVERARHARHDPPRPQPPQRHHVEHRQRDPRAGSTPTAGKIAKRLTGHLPSRRTRRGRRPPAFNQLRRRDPATGSPTAVDIPGFNYQPMRYAEDHAASIPKWIDLRLRDGLVRQLARRRTTCRSRNTRSTPRSRSPATTSSPRPGPTAPTSSSPMQDECRNVLGEFVWTGFDYLGEPTPFFGWDSRPTRMTGRRAAPTSASSTSPASPRTATTSIRACGRRRRWSTCCRTGTGRAREGQPIR